MPNNYPGINALQTRHVLLAGRINMQCSRTPDKVQESYHLDSVNLGFGTKSSSSLSAYFNRIIIRLNVENKSGIYLDETSDLCASLSDPAAHNKTVTHRTYLILSSARESEI